MRVVDILEKNTETWNGWHTRKSMWPVLHTEISVPVSFAGTISILTCVGTIISSLFSDKRLHRFGAGKVTAVSVAMTAVAMFGFSISNQLWMF